MEVKQAALKDPRYGMSCLNLDGNVHYFKISRKGIKNRKNKKCKESIQQMGFILQNMLCDNREISKYLYIYIYIYIYNLNNLNNLNIYVYIYIYIYIYIFLYIYIYIYVNKEPVCV